MSTFNVTGVGEARNTLEAFRQTGRKSLTEEVNGLLESRKPFKLSLFKELPVHDIDPAALSAKSISRLRQALLQVTDTDLEGMVAIINVLAILPAPDSELVTWFNTLLKNSKSYDLKPLLSKLIALKHEYAVDPKVLHKLKLAVVRQALDPTMPGAFAVLNKPLEDLQDFRPVLFTACKREDPSVVYTFVHWKMKGLNLPEEDRNRAALLYMKRNGEIFCEWDAGMKKRALQLIPEAEKFPSTKPLLKLLGYLQSCDPPPHGVDWIEILNCVIRNASRFVDADTNDIQQILPLFYKFPHMPTRESEHAYLRLTIPHSGLHTDLLRNTGAFLIAQARYLELFLVRSASEFGELEPRHFEGIFLLFFDSPLKPTPELDRAFLTFCVNNLRRLKTFDFRKTRGRKNAEHYILVYNRWIQGRKAVDVIMQKAIQSKPFKVEGALTYESQKEFIGPLALLCAIEGRRNSFCIMPLLKPSSNILFTLQFINRVVAERVVSNKLNIEDLAALQIEDIARLAMLIGLPNCSLLVGLLSCRRDLIAPFMDIVWRIHGHEPGCEPDLFTLYATLCKHALIQEVPVDMEVRIMNLDRLNGPLSFQLQMFEDIARIVLRCDIEVSIDLQNQLQEILDDYPLPPDRYEYFLGILEALQGEGDMNQLQ